MGLVQLTTTGLVQLTTTHFLGVGEVMGGGTTTAALYAAHAASPAAGMYPPPQMTCMYPPSHMACMYAAHAASSAFVKVRALVHESSRQSKSLYTDVCEVLT
jgi:hypothetical protein